MRKVSQAFSASSLLCARAYLTEVMSSGAPDFYELLFSDEVGEEAL